MRQSITFIPALILDWILSVSAWAQAPTGIIAGAVTDSAGGAVMDARIKLTNPATGLTRTATTGTDGEYSFPSLLAGEYQVTADAKGFRLLSRTATVEAGQTTTVNLPLLVGDTSDKVTVDGAAPQIQYEQYQTSGVVLRQQIENLPLNGRNFLELAKLEPGVTAPTRASNNRTFVPALGQPRNGSTRVTVDGGSIMQVSAGGSAMNLSQEIVQEFQIATVNYDISTGVGAGGSVNIVTRSGGNDFHGGGYFFYRDHNLSAYPALSRDPSNLDPFFQRKQWGGVLGGPIRKDRLFFFVNVERNDQRGVIAAQQASRDFAGLGVIAPNPSTGTQASARFDLRLSEKQTGFLRYSHDGSRTFGPAADNQRMPSTWLLDRDWVDLSTAGLTSVLSPKVVNDLRFSYFFVSVPRLPGGPGDCRIGCIGIGAPQITVDGANFLIGQSRTGSTVGRRYHLNDGLTWQKGAHRLRQGFEWEHTTLSQFSVTNDPASLTVYSPEVVQGFNATAPAAQRISIPASFQTIDDILQLPLKSFTTRVGNSRPPEPGFEKGRSFDLWRLYWHDTWRLRPTLTLNYGLSWSYEPRNLNYDLTRPAFLAPILGSGNLGAPRNDPNNIGPSAGFAWNIGGDGKTVLRGGAGVYYDLMAFGPQLNGERIPLLPLSTASRQVPSSAVVYDGALLDFPKNPSPFTGAQLLKILPGIRAQLLSQTNTGNRDFSVRNIDLDKSTAVTTNGIFVPDFTTAYSLNLNVGVQREIVRDLVVTGDFVVRQFTHLIMLGVDYNRFDRFINGVRSPVIPVCPLAQRNDVTVECSNGSIVFHNSSGRARYTGMLLRIDKRFSKRTQFLASYALSSNVGAVGPGNGFNNDNWFENYGPLQSDQRHVLNLSGIVELPWRFQLSASASFYSVPPFSVFLNGVDLNGDGTKGDLLPGTKTNQFNRGLGASDLVRLVSDYNQQYAGKKDAAGIALRPINLPSDYSFGGNTQTEDVRLSRTFAFAERYKLILMGEVFNVFNLSNVSGQSGNLLDSSFGQPTSRVSQVFGSGGPRAFQLAARFSF